MAKKEAKEETTVDPFGGDYNPDTDGFPGDFDEGINFDTDFDLDDEYKPTPLAPKGNYFGSVSGVKWDGQNQALIWNITLSDENEGVMSDGETPLAGQVFYYRNWFPRLGDETEMSKRGNQTKRQAKINMIKDFADGMKISMSSPEQIIQAVQNQDWVGMPVIASVTIESYEGRHRNSISKMVCVQ